MRFPAERLIVPPEGTGCKGCRSLPRAGLKRIVDNALAGAVLGFSVRRRNRGVPGGRRRGGRADLAFLQGPAGLFPASGLRAAGHDARARFGRLAARRIFQGTPAVSADPGGSEAGHQRVPGRRGQELLRAWRHRLFRHGARRDSLRTELRFQPAAAGRLHHHPAGGEELPPDQRGVVFAQDQGSLAGDADRAHVFERQDSRTLSERNLSRPRRLRHRRRLAGLFRQIGQRTHGRGSLLSGIAAEGAGGAASGAQPRPRDRAPQLCDRPPFGKRLDQAGRRRQGAQGSADRDQPHQRRAHLRRRIFCRRGSPRHLRALRREKAV